MEEDKKWKVPRGKSSTKAKNRYRDANYDRCELALPKERMEREEV